MGTHFNGGTFTISGTPTAIGSFPILADDDRQLSRLHTGNTYNPIN
jgi:hypothetical protein